MLNTTDGPVMGMIQYPEEILEEEGKIKNEI